MLWRSLGILSLSVTPAWASQSTSLPPMPNLAANPGFEERRQVGALPAAWSGDPVVYTRDETVARSGRSSLRFANQDAARYVLCTQPVQLEAGRRYQISVWAKTESIEGEDSGATVCLEFWKDGSGKPAYLGGCYPKGVKGTKDWTLVKGISRRVPAEAKRCNLTCYVRKGMTGTTWFDDVQIRRTADPIMQTVLVSPGYRGRVVPGQTREIITQVTLNLDDYDIKADDVSLQATVLPSGGGRALSEARATARTDAPLQMVLPADDLPEGDLVLHVSLMRKRDEATLAMEEHMIRRMPESFRPASYIDRHQRLIITGEPFFPLGMYSSGINEADIRIFADSPFNCLMPYGSPKPEQMDLAQKHGLKVIFSIKDFYAGSSYCPKFIKTQADEEMAVRNRVRQHRNHPALLAWYLNDELPLSYMSRLNAHQKWVEEEDPNHPTWVVLYQVGDVTKYIRSFDVIGTDPYPIPKSSPSMAADWTRKTLVNVARGRPVWMVPQVFNWANYRKTEEERKGLHPPTLPEMRSMAWQCICEGATGLIFYSFFDLRRDKTTSFKVLWERCKTMAAEIKPMIPVILSVEPAPEIRIQAGEWLHHLVRKRGDKVYIAAVNDGDGEGAAKFMLPKGTKSVQVLNEGRMIVPKNSTFTDSFDKLAVHLYEIEMAAAR